MIIEGVYIYIWDETWMFDYGYGSTLNTNISGIGCLVTQYQTLPKCWTALV